MGNKSFQYGGVAFGRLRNPHGVGADPIFDLSPCIADRFRLFKYAGIAHQTNKGEQTRPRQPHTTRSRKLGIKPGSGCDMIGERAHMGIHEQIRINKDHLKSSPSATASASATSSSRLIRHTPRSTVRVAKGLAGAGGALKWVNPSRRAAFMASFRERFRLRRTCSRRLETSGSNVSVVLIHQNIKLQAS